jgi:anti-anti-sigma regulatory factor
MTQKRIVRTLEQGVPVVAVETYFDAEIGVAIVTIADEILRDGGLQLIIDLGACPIINSSGVASLLDLSCKIVQDYRGDVFLVGLDQLKRSVLDIGGVLFFAEEKASRAEALASATAVRATPAPTERA